MKGVLLIHDARPHYPSIDDDIIILGWWLGTKAPASDWTTKQRFRSLRWFYAWYLCPYELYSGLGVKLASASILASQHFYIAGLVFGFAPFPVAGFGLRLPLLRVIFDACGQLQLGPISTVDEPVEIWPNSTTLWWPCHHNASRLPIQ